MCRRCGSQQSDLYHVSDAGFQERHIYISHPRIALRIPLLVPSDPVARLRPSLSSLVHCTCSTESWLCPGHHRRPVAAAELHRTLRYITRGLSLPAGTKFTPRSLRSRGISPAYATGLPLPVIMQLANHHTAEVVHWHYLDAWIPPSHAARFFFSRFRGQSDAATLGPVAPPWQPRASSADYVEVSADNTVISPRCTLSR